MLLGVTKQAGLLVRWWYSSRFDSKISLNSFCFKLLAIYENKIHISNLDEMFAASNMVSTAVYIYF